MSTEEVKNVEYIEDIAALEKQGMFKEAWRRLKQSHTAILGLIVLVIVISTVLIAPFFIPKERVFKQDIPDKFASASKEHWFGTDDFGRDTFARIVYGGRASLTIGFVGAILSLVSGGVLGLMVGYYGGRFDNIVMRFVDILSSVPTILLAMAIVSVLGSSLRNLLIAVTIARIPAFTRIIRADVISEVEKEYIEAAHAGGTSDVRILFKHLLPNVMGTVIVQTTMNMSGIMLQAAALSFLGLGIQPPNPEWGAMLSNAREYMRQSPMLMMYPGLAIVATTLSLSLLGDGLRDAFDPRLRT